MCAVSICVAAGWTIRTWKRVWWACPKGLAGGRAGTAEWLQPSGAQWRTGWTGTAVGAICPRKLMGLDIVDKERARWDAGTTGAAAIAFPMKRTFG